MSLTPPWQPVKVIRREGGLGVGAITEFRLILGFIPVRWLAEHIECQTNRIFVDKQVDGPDGIMVTSSSIYPRKGTNKIDRYDRLRNTRGMG